MGARSEGIVIPAGSQDLLVRWASDPSTPATIAKRARMVLQAAEGASAQQIASAHGVSKPTVQLWIGRFRQSGPEGIRSIRAGRGRKSSLSQEKLSEIRKSGDSANGRPDVPLSVRQAAKRFGVSPATVHRIWSRNSAERVTPASGGQERAETLATERQVKRNLDASVSETTGPGLEAIRLPITTFVGRDDALEQLQDLIGTARLVTLCGPAGIGKTRLAFHLAADSRESYPGGTMLRRRESTAPIARPARSTGAIKRENIRSTASMVEALRTSQPALLILDGCETALERRRELTHILLTELPTLIIVATSQEPLGLDGEVIWRVPPIAISERLSGREQPDSPALRLFCDRVKAVRPTLLLDDEKLNIAADICFRLDGVPLAIEEAARLAETLSLQDILDQCKRDQPLALLPEAAPNRHPGIEKSLAHNFELLSVEEQVLFRRLSVFQGGFGLNAAAQVGAAHPIGGERILPLLSGLVRKSLLVSEVNGMQSRFKMLGVVRRFAKSKLLEAGESQALRDCHADWFLRLAGGQADPVLDQKAWLQEMEDAQDDLRTSLEWGLSAGHGARAVDLAASLVPFWLIRGHFREGRELLEKTLIAGGETSQPLRATLMNGAGLMAAMTGDFAGAISLAEESLALGPDGGACSRARALTLMGYALMFSDGPGAALPFLSEAVRMAEEIEEPALLAETHARLGHAQMYQGSASSAVESFETCLSAATDACMGHLEALGMIGLAWATNSMGDRAKAGSLFEGALRISRDLGDKYRIGEALSFLAEGLLGQGRLSQAEESLRECLEIAMSIHSPVLEARALRQLASVAQRSGESDRAMELFKRAVSVARKAGLSFILVRSLQGLADLLVRQHKIGIAKEHLEECVSLARERLDTTGMVQGLSALAAIAESEGDAGKATELHHQILQLRLQFNHSGALRSLKSVAKIASGRGDHTTAVRLYAGLSAQQSCSTSGCLCGQESQVSEADLTAARKALGEGKFAAAWEEGKRLSLEETVAYASRGRGSRSRPSSGWQSLTPTEEQVAGRVVEGLSNHEIGGQLFMSPRTVGAHLSHIYRKLGVSSRRELREAARERTGEVDLNPFRLIKAPLGPSSN